MSGNYTNRRDRTGQDRTGQAQQTTQQIKHIITIHDI